MIDFKPRAMMERAIDQMRKSIAESRSDGKVSPKVGAVLLHVGDESPGRGGRIQEAYRGELRDGDHAEFTLLERKNRDRALDKCVLFATLEPCAPGARKHPKLSCAERIVLARIKKVWIGIEDPDPTVARRGIEYLRSCGVEVLIFDRDLQEIIQEENAEFLKQARQRAVEAIQPKEVILSPLELPPPAVDWSDFSTDALNAYRRAANMPEETESETFQRRLLQQGVLKEINGTLKPSGFGNVLFGKTPRTSTPQAGVLATIHYANGKEEVKDFDGPQVLVPSDLIKWLRDKLPNVIDRSDATRSEQSDPLFELVREGIVNAIVHRDYSIEGAKCQLHVYPNKLEILSPGNPVFPITFEQIQGFDAPMLSRNPVLHFVFAKMGLAEERGLGLKSMRSRATESGLPLPKYSQLPPYINLTLFPSSKSSLESLASEIADQLNESERAGWVWLSKVGVANTPEYSAAMSLDERTSRRHLQQFVKIGLVRKVGAGKATKYETN
jgi:ATP-dependent DNA helicase RecG